MSAQIMHDHIDGPGKMVLVVCGFSRATYEKAKANMIHLGALGVLEIDCLGCQGTGVWDFMEPLEPATKCIECKGTGKVYIGG